MVAEARVCRYMIIPLQKEKLNFLCQENKFKKFKPLLDAALKNWESKTPVRHTYGLFYKAGKFATKNKCCLISSALNNKEILEELYNKSPKISRFYEFCVEIHFNLLRDEVSAISLGFDQKLFEDNGKFDKNAYLFGLGASKILFGFPKTH